MASSLHIEPDESYLVIEIVVLVKVGDEPRPCRVPRQLLLGEFTRSRVVERYHGSEPAKLNRLLSEKSSVSRGF
jgi:hypothetical protein